MIKSIKSYKLNGAALLLSNSGRIKANDLKANRLKSKCLIKDSLINDSLKNKDLKNNGSINDCLTTDSISQSMAIKNKTRQNELDSTSVELTEILLGRYRANRIYPIVMFLLALGIIGTAVMTAEQVQQYHNDYMKLQKMKVEHRNLQIENQRLIIEQQTFSATPQIASRAVTQLGMYSPTTKDKLILQPMSTTQGDRLNIDERAISAEPAMVEQGGDDE